MRSTWRNNPTQARSIAVLVILCVLGWAAIFWSVAHMAHPWVQLMMPRSADWRWAEFAMVLLMWALMMGAMMLPSALPMIATHRRIRPDPRRHAAFVAAYLLMWVGFSLIASLLQLALQMQGLLTRMLVVNSDTLAGLVLIGIGAFQLSPLKTACLHHCRTPLGFLMTDWREGPSGAFVMGLRHGLFCIGCCWALMLALFVFGVMNIYAIAAISTWVALEKLFPWGHAVAKATGVACLGFGLYLLI